VTTLRMPPDEFAVVRKFAAALAGVSAEDAARQFTADEIRAFLGEHVTVVAPGETLVIRVDAPPWTPNQMHELQGALNEAHEDGFPRCLVVPGAELGVVKPDVAHMAVSLRAAGSSFAEIGQALGITEGQAMAHVDAELRKTWRDVSNA
jgi:hypothetical protein